MPLTIAKLAWAAFARFCDALDAVFARVDAREGVTPDDDPDGHLDAALW